MGGLGPKVKKDSPLYIYRCSQLIRTDLPGTVKVTQGPALRQGQKKKNARKEGRKGFTSIEELEDYIKKSKERLITETSNSTDNKRKETRK